MKPVSSAPGMCHTVFKDAGLMEAYIAVYLLPRDSVLIEDASHAFTFQTVQNTGASSGYINMSTEAVHFTLSQDSKSPVSGPGFLLCLDLEDKLQPHRQSSALRL